jgi:Putative restriction endonuclease
MFETWRVWEKGAPELAIEVLSPSDTREPLSFSDKLGRYASTGVLELIAFDVDAPAGERLRGWDRMGDVLVERVVTGERTPCLTLGGMFVLAPAQDQPVALRLARDAEGEDLVLTALEQCEQERAAKEQERAAKEAALAEVARLRHELART